jgi:hypothetical protein
VSVLPSNHLRAIFRKFGTTAATSELRESEACFLQLIINRLVVDKGTHRQGVLMKLTLPQFYQFSQQMEVANKQCQ